MNLFLFYVANFVQPSISSNSNDILHQFVIGNPRTNSLGPSLSLSATAAPTLVVPAPAPPTAATSPSTIGTSTMITPVANVSSTGDRCQYYLMRIVKLL